jgi:hypothetical protein
MVDGTDGSLTCAAEARVQARARPAVDMDVARQRKVAMSVRCLRPMRGTLASGAG